MSPLPIPAVGQADAEAFVRQHLRHLVCDDVSGSRRFRGGQSAADAALAQLDIAGYAAKRNEVYPEPRRGASMLSPYLRHGLLQLRSVWDAVTDAPERDRQKYRDELLWQEFARHWYGRLGVATQRGVRNTQQLADPTLHGWRRDLPCLDLVVGELERDGWLVNQSRMWLASDWTVRNGGDWRRGEELFFQHLLDGSRAANRLGWQWTTGVGSSKPYGFSRWQVEKRAPGLCGSCPHHHNCPLQDWPDDPSLTSAERSPLLTHNPDVLTASGPADPVRAAPPEAVWLTAESLGADDPALAANPELPAVFVFDQPLLARLRLSSKRLVFLVETLAELATQRRMELHLGRPAELLAGRSVAVTFAPVPGFRRRSEAVGPAELHPWPWLVRPTSGPVTSFSAWRRSVGRPR